jgi:hypothetical protein
MEQKRKETWFGEQISSSARRQLSMATDSAMLEISKIRRRYADFVYSMEQMEENYWHGQQSADEIITDTIDLLGELYGENDLVRLVNDAKRIAKLRLIGNGLSEADQAFLENA